MTDLKTVYLDTGVLRPLWKLHLGHWPRDDNRHRIHSEHLRRILRNEDKRFNVAAVASVFTIIEMAQFDQSKNYASIRLAAGDDAAEILLEWGRPTWRWSGLEELLHPVLDGTVDNLEKWSGGEDHGLVSIYHGPWPNPGQAAEIPLLLGFALRLCLSTPVDPDDCYHVAYTMRYCDAILTTDQGLLDSLSRTLNDEGIMDSIRADYRETFKVDLPTAGFRVFRYPNQLCEFEHWSLLS